MRFFLLLLSTLALAGCASHQSPVPLESYTPVATAAPSPAVAAAQAYYINPLDQLRIDVFGEPDLSVTDLPVDPDGNIVMPLVGSIQAAGLTTEQLSDKISTALLRYLRHPKVAVNVTQFTSQKITVAGAVNTPGVFQAMHQMTLIDAIALGQGLGDYSEADQIVVFRRQGGQRYAARFDLTAIEDGTAADPTILPGDAVIVGFSEAKRRYSKLLSVLPIAAGIFVALLPRL